MSGNSFSDYWGRTPGFSKLVTIDKVRQLRRGDVTVVEVAVGFRTFLFPDGFDCRPRKFTGRCRCSMNDIYDADMGLYLAEHKARAKAYRYVYRVFKDNAAQFAGIAGACLRIAGKARRKGDAQAACFRRKGGVEA